MKRIALIVLATVLAFTTSLFGFVNTANAEDIQSCGSLGVPVLNPGEKISCRATDVTLLTLNVSLFSFQEKLPATVLVRSTTNPKPNCTNLNITLNSESQDVFQRCQVGLETITILNDPTSKSRVDISMIAIERP